MKILWMTNYPLPVIANQLRMKAIVNEGWLTTLSNKIAKEHELIICCAVQGISENINMTLENIHFHIVNNSMPYQYNPRLVKVFADILLAVEPEIVHIMGTEFPHAYAMYQACENSGMKDRCVVSIQGIISKIANFYDNGVERLSHKARLRDYIFHDSVKECKKQFILRGHYEELLISKVNNIIGRTEWDYCCIKQMNPDINYFKCNETLRGPFYEAQWQYEKCDKKSVIMSQATYPVKGFHFLLQACVLLKKYYPDIKVYVPSNTAFPKGFTRFRYINNDYTNYICDFMKKHDLIKNVIFLGELGEQEMRDAYLRANIYVSPSTIENSSNSLGEAMLLGMPVIASCVGGIPSMMDHRKEGLLYPAGDVTMLCMYILELLRNPQKAAGYALNARKRAQSTHQMDKNYKDQIECYETIINNR